MKLNKKLFIYGGFPLAALGLAAAGSVSAHGWFWDSNATPQQIAQNQQQMFQNQANMLGMSVDDYKNLWAQGKNFREIAQEKGVTQDQLKQKMQDQMKQNLQERLNTLVQQGVITQEQANQRLQNMQNKIDSDQMGRHGMHHGFGKF